MEVLFIMALVLFSAVSALAVLRNLHMFQLNSYKAGTQIPWLFKSAARLVPSLLLLLLSALSLTGGTVFFVLELLGLLIMGLANLPRKAKKPLKYTARVIRLLVTTAVLCAAAAVAACLLPRTWGLALLGAFCALLPLLLLLANLINAPAEAAVRRWYTNDAKHLLRACPELVVIGVTGSYGKTSVKFFLGALLRARYNTLVTPENYNTPMGVVKTVRGSLRATHEMFVCEMGAKYKGDIRELCRLAHPRYGIITSIGEQHLETFGSLEAIVKTKFEIYSELPENGILFVNGDCAAITENLPSGGARIVRYGMSAGCDYRATETAVSRSGTIFTVCFPDGSRCRYTTKLIGTHNVVNLTGAVAAAVELGLSPEELAPYMKKLAPVPHRLQLIENGDLTIIDDAYNSNPSGCRAALETLSLFPEYKVLVTPGMVELGDLQDNCNRQFGQEAAAVCDFIVLVGEKQTSAIREGLDAAGYPAEKLFVAAGIHEALAHVNALLPGRRKIVLLENDLPDNY